VPDDQVYDVLSCSNNNTRVRNEVRAKHPSDV
jgi:hypothetical protein